MDLFTYLMAKNGQNTQRDLFSYLLGKGSGGGGTYTTFTGTSLNILNSLKAQIKNFMLNSTELTQDSTPTPDNPVDVHIITGNNSIKIMNKNIFNPILLSQEENYNNFNSDTGLWETSALGGYYRSILYNVSGSQNVRETNKLIFLKANTNYTIKFYDFSYTGSGSNYLSYGFFNDLGTYINQINGNEFINITTPSQSCYLDIRRVASSGNFKFSKIMIIEGTYTEEDMPNYIEHQEQNYSITLSSKNLFDKDTAVYKNGYYKDNSGNELTTSISGYTTSYTKVKPNTTYTISVSIRTVNANGGIYCYDNSKNWIERITWTGGENTSFTFTTPNNCYYIQIQYTQEVIDGDTIQIEEGSSATTYTSYYSLEYCKIGDYADQIFKNTTNSPYYDNTLIENEWYLKKNVGKVSFVGADSEVYEKMYGSIYNNRCMFYLKNIPHNNSNYNLMKSNRFVATAGASEYYPEGINVSYNSNQFVLNLMADKLTEYTNAALRTFFQNNNTDVYYVIETPTYIHISQADYPTLKTELDNLYNNAKSYDGQTNITQTNDDLSFNISVDVKVANL